MWLFKKIAKSHVTSIKLFFVAGYASMPVSIEIPTYHPTLVGEKIQAIVCRIETAVFHADV